MLEFEHGVFVWHLRQRHYGAFPPSCRSCRPYRQGVSSAS